ncbi:MAG: hypothetical protein JWQ27_1624 [Ferruginibacter sp.]|nr:hypothetical protein [Ferruginibacter sp.]
MKTFIQTLALAIILVSCGSTKNYLERSDEDKALLDAVRKLNKSAADENATQALPVLYSNITASHLAKIKSYQTGKDINRWDKIIREYEDLQEAYNALINSTAAFRLVNPRNFNTELLESRQAAADEYYAEGERLLQNGDRDNAKQAYAYFKKTEKFVPSYKDARRKMDEAYENAIVDVIINPVQDNSFFFNTGWGNSGYNYSNEYFQQTLLRELQNENSNGRYAARFYTDWEARRDNVTPDWVVNLTLRDMDIPYPSNNSYRRNVSAQVQNGTDTAGRPIYKTVYATVNTTRQSFTARATMEMSIKDIASGRLIANRSIREDYRWEQERGSYSGDSRALSQNDWNIINNTNSYNQPRKEDVLNELYRKIYPQVKNNIRYSVDW